MDARLAKDIDSHQILLVMFLTIFRSFPFAVNRPTFAPLFMETDSNRRGGVDNEALKLRNPMKVGMDRSDSNEGNNERREQSNRGDGSGRNFRRNRDENSTDGSSRNFRRNRDENSTDGPSRNFRRDPDEGGLSRNFRRDREEPALRLDNPKKVNQSFL